MAITSHPGGLLKLRRRTRRRLKIAGLSIAGAAAIAAVAAVASAGINPTPPPVSEKVQQAYESGSALAPASSAANPTGIAAARKISEKVQGQKVNLLLPAKPNGQLVVAAHGHGGDAGEWFKGAQQTPMLSALLDAGYSVASSDASGDAWGNPQSVADYSALHSWAMTKGKFKSVVLLGQSMGGLPALQLLGEIPNVTAFVGIYPVCDLGTMAPKFKDIATAWPEGAEGHLSPVDLTAAKGKRMIFFASPTDTVVPKATNTDACAAAAKAAGADVTVAQVAGDHGDQSAFRPDVVVDFLTAAPAR